MNIFIDMDYTILTWDGKLRPGVTELFQRLKEDGHDIYIWSGLGIRWDEVRRHGLERYVSDCFQKPLFNYRHNLAALGVSPRPDIVIDDYPDIVTALGGIKVRPYVYEKETDVEMERVYQIISSLKINGYSQGIPDESSSSQPA